MDVLPGLCMCTVCMPDTYVGQKRALNPLKLELWVVVSPHMGARNQSQILWKTRKCFLPLSYLSSPELKILSYLLPILTKEIN